MTRAKATPLCGAPAKSTGKPCRNVAGYKTDHVGVGRCHRHLGNSPTHVKAAQEEQARAAMVTYGRPVEVGGVDALLNELHWTAGHVAYLRTRVQELVPEALTWGISRRADDALLGTKETWDAGTHALVKLYLEERKHLVEVAATCARLGIDERKVRLAETQGALLVAGLQWFVTKLQLSARKAELANSLALEMFRFLDAGQVPTIEGFKP